jgi:hypothetical protein
VPQSVGEVAWTSGSKPRRQFVCGIALLCPNRLPPHPHPGPLPEGRGGKETPRLLLPYLPLLLEELGEEPGALLGQHARDH